MTLHWPFVTLAELRGQGQLGTEGSQPSQAHRRKKELTESSVRNFPGSCCYPSAQ